MTTAARRPRPALARGILALAALGALATAPARAQTPTHAYRINGGLADELGGPSLASLGGAVGPTATRSAKGRG